MKRFHVHLSVADLPASARFYSALFGAEPVLIREDYAKWALEDPRLNFAISTRGAKTGLDHLGFQADHEGELAELETRARAAAGEAVVNQKQAGCCYARSNKAWAVDPQGIAWEQFHSLGRIDVFGEDTQRAGAACCVPDTARAPQAAEAVCCDGPAQEAGACCG